MRAAILFACVGLAACVPNRTPMFPSPTAAPAPPPRVDAPIFRTGQEWIFAFTDEIDMSKSGGYSQHVERVENGRVLLSVLVGRVPGVAELDQNACLVRGPRVEFSPSNEALRFPLFVGKTWSADYVFSSGAWGAKDRREAKVVSFERVETPAGSFEAFRIEATIAWSGVAVGSDAGHARETAWYAPSVCRVIKERYVDYPNNKNAAPTSTHYELVHYAAPLPVEQ